MILNHAYDTLSCGVFANISSIFAPAVRVFLKIEAFNAAGSVKLKPAIGLVEAQERLGNLTGKRNIIDTTSGNMGIALAVVAKCKGHGFVCVTDEKMTMHNRSVVAAYGAEIVVMPNSTLDERYRYIQSRMAKDSSLVWTRQFTSPDNPLAHQETTAREILDEFEKVNYLFIGVGTGGTLAGCSKAFSERSPHTKIFAVDVEGSFHFEEPEPRIKRRIPGIGATKRSPFLNDARIHKAVIVSERDTVRACTTVRDASGWLVGGSTGSIIAAAQAMKKLFSPGDTVVCLGADMGERYLNTIYNENWVGDEFGDIENDQEKVKSDAAT
jgi:N-(2-amino-2-carboxyethyl)-L-glutamate synthase